MAKLALPIVSVTYPPDELLRKLMGQSTVSLVPERPPVAGAIAWARVSTDEQAQKGLSIPEQLRQIRAYAAQHGMDIVQEFHEAASAFTDEAKRTEFHRMLATVKAHPEISVILVHDYSRFSRDSLRAQQLVEEMGKGGVRVISLNDLWFDRETPTGVYMQAITFAKNEAYSREISFHTRKGNRANIQTRDPETGWCYKNAGMAIWGYRALRVARVLGHGCPVIKRVWELDDTEFAGKPIHEWVRYCLVELAGNGATIPQLLEFCRTHQLPRRRGGGWHQSSWRRMLGPDSLLQYSGYALWGTKLEDGRSFRPMAEWVIVPDAHPALITLEEAHTIAVVSRGQRVRKLYRRLAWGESAPYLLSGGVFRCSQCGGAMMGYDPGSYLCAAQAKTKYDVCRRSVYVSRPVVERRVLAGLRRILQAVADPDGVLEQVNQELAAAFAKAQTPRDAKPKTRRAKAPTGPDAQEPGAPGAEVLLASQPGDGGDYAEMLVGRLRHPPQIDCDAAQRCASLAAAHLESGTPAQRKLAGVAWVERVQVHEENRRLVVQYRLPEQLTRPAGLGAWCCTKSRRLASLLRRRWTLPAGALVPAPRSFAREIEGRQ